MPQPMQPIDVVLKNCTTYNESSPATEEEEG